MIKTNNLVLDYIKSLNKEQITKGGWDKIKVTDKDIIREIDEDAPIDFKNLNDSYLLMLKYDKETSTYLAVGNGYGILKIQDGKIYDYKTKSFQETNLLK